MSATTRRADAARNDEEILKAAMIVLSRDPTAGLNAIAAECGISRVTIFRRYATRDELIAAVRTRAHAELDAAADRADLTSGTAVEALERLIDGLSEVMQHPAPPGRGRRIGRISRQIETLIARGQTAGEFSSVLPPAWWIAAIVAVLQAATEFSAPSAAELMRETLLNGLRS
jgi:AcrR family transcriptional regulator